MLDKRLVQPIGIDVSQLLKDVDVAGGAINEYKKLFDDLKKYITDLAKQIANIELNPNLNSTDFMKELSQMRGAFENQFGSMFKTVANKAPEIKTLFKNMFAALQDQPEIGEELQHLEKIFDSFSANANKLKDMDIVGKIFGTDAESRAKGIESITGKLEKYGKAASSAEGDVERLNNQINALNDLLIKQQEATKAAEKMAEANKEAAETAKVEKEAIEATNKALEEQNASLQKKAKAMTDLQADKILARSDIERKYVVDLIKYNNEFNRLRKEYSEVEASNQVNASKLADHMNNLRAQLEAYKDGENIANGLVKDVEAYTKLGEMLKKYTGKKGIGLSEGDISNIKSQIESLKGVFNDSKNITLGFTAKNAVANVFGVDPDEIEKRLDSLVARVEKHKSELKEGVSDSVQGAVNETGAALDDAANMTDKTNAKLEETKVTLQDILRLEIDLYKEEQRLGKEGLNTSEDYNKLSDSLDEGRQKLSKFFANKDVEDYQDAIRKVYDSTKNLLDFLKEGGDVSKIASHDTDWINTLKKEIGNAYEYISDKGGYKKNIFKNLFSMYGEGIEQDPKSWIVSASKVFAKINKEAEKANKTARASKKAIQDALKPIETPTEDPAKPIKDVGDALEETGKKAKRTQQDYDDAEKKLNAIFANDNAGTAVSNTAQELENLGNAAQNSGAQVDSALKDTANVAKETGAQIDQVANATENAGKKSSDGARRTNSELRAAYTEQIQLIREIAKLSKEEETKGVDNSEYINPKLDRLTYLEGYIEAQEKSVRSSEKEAAALREVEKANEAVAKARRDAALKADKTNQRKEEADLVQQAARAYEKLKQAYSGYLNTTKSHDDVKRGEWADEITAQETILHNIREQAEELDHNSDAYKKIQKYLEDSATASSHMDDQLKGVHGESEKINNTVDQIFRRIYSMLILRYLRQMLRDCVTYVQEFDKSMTNVRMVTKMTADEAEVFGARIRDAATDLRMTSTDLAQGAVSIFRQGITDPDQVIDISKWTAVLAAITSDTSDNVLDYMTASLQNFQKEGEQMEDTAERIADVWGWMGDQVATTSGDIGTALSKTASSATSVGLSLEKTSAMVAVIQAKTQDAAESVGNSLNSMLSRYMKLTEQGYGAIFEDEDGEMVRFNDVAKAMASASIEIYNTTTGFANMGDVLDQLYNKWGGLDEATQKYIATQMAGTRNMNRFMAMMNNYEQVLKLEAGAYDSAGAAMEKYNIWMESVEAAHNKLTNSLQNLYSTLDSDILKGFYNILSTIVDGLNSATKATHGWNIIITAITVAVAALFVSLRKLGGGASIVQGLRSAFLGVASSAGTAATATGAATTAVNGLNAAMSATIWGIIALVGTSLASKFITWLEDVADDSEEFAEANKKVKATLDEIGQSQQKITKIDGLFGDLENIQKSAGSSKEKLEQLKTVRQAIIDMSPDVAAKYGLEAEAVGSYTSEINKTIEALKELQRQEFESAKSTAIQSLGTLPGALAQNKVRATDTLYYLPRMREIAKNNKGMIGYKDLASLGKETQAYWRDILGLSTNENYSFNIRDVEVTAQQQAEQYRQLVQDAIYTELIAYSDQDVWESIGIEYGSNSFLNILRGMSRAFSTENIVTPDIEYISKTPEVLQALYEKYLLSRIDMSQVGSGEREDIVSRLAEADKTLSGTQYKNVTMGANENVNGAIEQYNASYQRLTDNLGYLQESIDDYRGALEETEGEIGDIDIRHFMRYLQELGMDNQRTFDAMTSYLSLDEEDFDTDTDMIKEWYRRYIEVVNAIVEDMNSMNEGIEIPEGESAIDKIVDSIVEGTSSGEGSKTADDIKTQLESVQDTIKVLDQLVQMSADIQSGDFAGNLLGGKYDEELLKNYPAILENMNDRAALEQIIADAIQQQVDGIRQQGEAYSELYDQRQEQEYEESAQKFLGADPEEAAEMWEEFNDETKKYIEENYEYATGMFEDLGDEYYDVLKDMEKDTNKETKKISKAIAKAQIDQLFDEKKINKTTKDVLDTLIDNTDDAIDTVASFTKDIDSLTKAQEALAFVQQDGAASMEEFDNYAKILSDYVGYDVTTMNDFSMAASILSGDALLAGSSAEYLLNTLYAISGSTFDASNWSGSLLDLQSSSNSCANALAVLIAYLQSIDGTTISFDGDKFSVGNLGKVSIPKVSGGGGGGRGSGGGGGGGGGGSSKAKSQTEKLLSQIKDLLQVIEYERNLYKALQEYYDAQGLTQGVILWMEKEAEATQKSIDTIEKYMGTLKTMIADKEAELSKLKEGSDAYETAKEELHDLQEAYADYSVELVESKTAIIELHKSIDELNDGIRQMQIDILEMVEEAIRDREELLKDMRDGTIDVEDAILDAIKARYEREHELAEELADAKIKALEEEIDAIDELLDKRRELNEEEKTSTEIAELEAKLARISADPTRAKEALELQTKLKDLREEQAWDLAEKEAEAQKQTLQDEVDSVEEYLEELDKYYEDLFEHPQKLIAEMKEIIKGTDEEIIEWLKQSTEEYAEATDTRQEAMVVEWQEMLDQMRGTVRTYWEEAEQIVSQGDDAIIAFLKEHSADYREAGQLQAEAYVDEWRKKLEELRLALQEVQEEFEIPEYAIEEGTTTKSTTGGGGGSGGGSTGGGGGGSSKGTTTKSTLKTIGEKLQEEADRRKKALESIFGTTKSKTGKSTGGGTSAIGRLTTRVLAYDTGGLANYTGLAQLDGSPMKPERVLSSYQTGLFEDMIKTLHEIKMYRMNIPSVTPQMVRDATDAIHVDQINVSVERLESDQDIEELSDKVQQALLDAVNRGAAVGGIRRR